MSRVTSTRLQLESLEKTADVANRCSGQILLDRWLVQKIKSELYFQNIK